MKEYLLFYGGQEGFSILGVYAGPDDADLSSLQAQFCRENGLETPEIRSGDNVHAWIEQEMEAEDRLRAMGYEGDLLPNLFVSWLCKHHGFVRVEKEMFRVNLGGNKW